MNPALTPEVRSGLGAFGRTARALVGAVTLPELARGALAEMCDALGLDVAALYLPTGNGPTLARLAAIGADRHASERLVFDVEAWQLAVQGDTPLVMRDRGEWLMEHPFTPPADSWLVLPLGTGAGLGVVMTGADLPNAFPYVIAVERLLDASVGTGTALLVLALYAVVDCVPCLVLLALGLRHSDRVTGWLRRVHDRFGSEATMPANPWKALVLLVLAVAVGAVTVVA